MECCRPTPHSPSTPPAAHAEGRATATERDDGVDEAVEESGRSFALQVPDALRQLLAAHRGPLRALQGVRRVPADHGVEAVAVEHMTDLFEGQVRAKLDERGFGVVGSSFSLR